MPSADLRELFNFMPETEIPVKEDEEFNINDFPVWGEDQKDET